MIYLKKEKKKFININTLNNKETDMYWKCPITCLPHLSLIGKEERRILNLMKVSLGMRGVIFFT